MAKLSLTAAPTFKATVAIPIAGAKPAEVEFTFKHRTRDQFREFTENLGKREDIEVVMDIASGWDLDEPFSKESAEKMIQMYIGSAFAILNTYMAELSGARVKN